MTNRARKMTRWVTAAFLTVAGASASVLKLGGLDQWPWLAATIIVVAALLTPWNKVLVSQLEQTAKLKEERRINLDRGALHGTLVRNVNPIALGVHPSFEVTAESSSEDSQGQSFSDRLPTYVPRDLHERVIDELRPGNFVLILGHSGAGKSRLAFEAMRDVFRDQYLFAPEPPALIDALDEIRDTSDAVLWLDDLERFLGTNAFTPSAINRILGGPGHRRTILATFRLQELETLSADPDQHSSTNENLRRILALATQIHLKKEFSADEIQRARNRTQDPRIADALKHRESYGLAEYLAAGPQLLSKWQHAVGSNSHARAAALVTTAVECRRAGYLSRLPKALLEELSEHYLDRDAAGDDFDSAWKWSTEPWRGTATALLEIDSAEMVNVFEYIVDFRERTAQPGNYPEDKVVLSALKYADARDARNIGLRSFINEKYLLARSCYSHAMDRLVRSVGPGHPDTLTVRSEHADVLREIGDLQKAISEHGAVISTRTSTLGSNHPDTLKSRLDRADCLLLNDQIGEAYDEFRATLEVCNLELGSEHVITLKSRMGYAKVLQDMGDLDGALAESRSIVDTQTKILGPNHPDTILSRGTLALALTAMGRLNEAENEQRQTIERCADILGPYNPATLTERNNHATILFDQGKLKEAKAELRDLLELRTQKFGEDYRGTLSTRHNLAVVLHALGQTEEATTELQSVVEIRTRLLGARHSKTLSSRQKLATMFGDERLEEAIGEIESIISIRIDIRGAEALNTLASRHLLGIVLHRRSLLDRAETELQSVVDARTRLLGAEHPETLKSRSALGNVLRDRGQLGRAEAELTAVLVARTRLLGVGHPDTLVSQRDLDTARGVKPSDDPQ